jgi:hypothetical protein
MVILFPLNEITNKLQIISSKTENIDPLKFLFSMATHFFKWIIKGYANKIRRFIRQHSCYICRCTPIL